MKIEVVNESESNVTNVTVTLVKRVSERVAMGVPIELALAGEPVTKAEYQEQLSRNPNLAALQDIARREFLEDAIAALFSVKNPGSNIRWWLTHVYPEIFARPAKEEAVPREKQTILGISEASLEEARRYARQL